MFDFFSESPLPSPVSRLIPGTGRGVRRDEALSGVERNRLLFVRWLVEHQRLTESPVRSGNGGNLAAAGAVGPGRAGQ